MEKATGTCRSSQRPASQDSLEAILADKVKEQALITFGKAVASGQRQEAPPAELLQRCNYLWKANSKEEAELEGMRILLGKQPPALGH